MFNTDQIKAAIAMKNLVNSQQLQAIVEQRMKNDYVTGQLQSIASSSKSAGLNNYNINTAEDVFHSSPVTASTSTLVNPNESSSHAQKKRFVEIFEEEQINNQIPSMEPHLFRMTIFKASLKALSSELAMTECAQLNHIVDSFEPQTISQEFDKMAGKLLINSDLTCPVNVAALKFHNSSPSKQSITAEGLTERSKDLFKKMGKDKEGVLKKNLIDMAICSLKIESYQSGETDRQLFQVLDILSALLRSCIDDVGAHENKKSEMSHYRKIAQIFDIMFEDTIFNWKDGETMSNVSKKVCKNNTKLFGVNTSMTGRRIDLIIEAKQLELSTNEWRREVGFSSALKQQSKNIRMNKALLKHWLELPIPADKTSQLSVLAMDWVGSVGYMFSVSAVEDVFVSNYNAALQLPTYIADISDFLDTLNSLYQWKNHQIAMKDILLVAMRKKENNARLASLIPAHVSQIQSHGNDSPNVFFTPRKRRNSSIQIKKENDHDLDDNVDEDLDDDNDEDVDDDDD
ncbi:hypothetical protein INT46_011056 [Mucor plumbeus]|uniref:Uncharacterized protein n=1 Tax=Mucor plumbeus TaxID=97098 RepID=A0A8H7QUQ4_9FUNG|nr:hypothetical protein INT46_011056 [Mucor plumbeus]